MKIFMKKLAWEFWPSWLMYIHMGVLWPYFMLCTGKVRFWELVNPGLQNGGLIGDSKIASLSQLPKENLPDEFTVSSKILFSELLSKLESSNIQYPCIVKPDNGMRGKGVKKITSNNELLDYFKNIKKQTFLGDFKWVEDFLLRFNKKTQGEKIIVQEYISTKKEFGVFYIRKPNKKNGRVVSLMERKFPEIEGDGKSTLRELILQDGRASLYRKKYFKRYEKDLENILGKKEVFLLGSIGSHNLGTVFLNKTEYINADIQKTFDNLSKNVSGFYYGRYDVKAESLADLGKGDFKVLELNGLNAEPVHMYDSDIKPWQGWAILTKFWMKAFDIAMQNKNIIRNE